MRKHPALCVGLAVTLITVMLAGCSRDPNVRKQKYLESGQRYFEKEKYREAAIQFQNALQVDPRYAEAHHRLAQCYLKLGVWSGAYQELMRTVDLQPDNLKAHIQLGNLFLAGQEFKRAQEQAELVLQKDPNNLDAHVLRANAFGALQNVEASLQEMQTAIQLAPDRSRSYLNLAVLQISAKDTAAAEDSFKKAVTLDPKSATALLALGNFYQAQRRWAEAEQQFRRVIELEPKNPAPRAALARLYIAQEQRGQAEQVLIEAKKVLADNPDGYRMLGDFYFNLGEIDKALAEFASLYQEHPKDLRVKKNYIQLLILRDRFDEATKLNDEILEANPKDVEALIHRGQVLNGEGRPNDAVPVLESALKIEPDSAVGHYHLGASFSLLGNLARAESEWREAARLNPNMMPAQFALAEVAMRKGDVDLLSKSAEALIGANPLSPRGYALRATARFARKDLAGGEADLKKAIEVAPQNPLGYVQMGDLRMVQKRYEEAKELFEQSLQRDPNSVEALRGLVGIYLLQKEPAKALARVGSQIDRAPGNSTYYFIQAQLLVGNKNLEGAETALAKAVELNKNNVDAFLLLGQVQNSRGSFDKAIASYQRSIQENPRDVRGYVLLGMLEDAHGNWQRAQEIYQKALQVQPDYPLAANNLAYSMLEHGGNTDVALSLAQVARRGMPNMPNAADTLAWAYYSKGAYKLAIDLLEDALKTTPQNATYHYHLGLAYQKSNDRVRAKEHLEQALRINPGYSRADDIKKALAELAGS
jgi:tetratricopeptide (TPR) repeat protein